MMLRLVDDVNKALEAECYFHRIKDNNNKIDRFELVMESEKPFDIYGDAASINNDGVKSYRVNVRRLCLILCCNAKAYVGAGVSCY